MKIFLSWSGDTSHKVACALRDWLPSVIQSVKPYVSSEDIDKGARWSSDIAQELEKSTYGIICVTKGNIDAPWVNFEAGALSKALDKSFVSPFLFNMNRADVQGPLLQFQSTVYESDDVEKLVGSVNSRLELHERLDDSKLKKAFDVWWPMLKEELDKIHEPTTLGDTEMVKDKHQLILEEIVELSRSQYKLLRDPESLLPQSYLNFVFESGRNRVSEASLDRLHRAVIRIQKQVEVEDEEDTTSKSIRDEIEVLHSLIHDLMRPPRLPRRTVPYVDEVKG